MATAIKEITVKLVMDRDAENPRNWDNLGTMVCAHRRYTTMGDEDGIKKALQFIRRHLSEAQLDEMGFDEDHVPSIEEALEKTGQVILLPIYMYDHSGIALQTTPFACRWDSGKLGFIFVTKEDVRNEYGWKLITQARKEKIHSYLEGEVETYHQFVSGDVWGFVVEEDGNEVDSCWGFFGSDPLTNGIFDHLGDEAKEVVKAGRHIISYQ